MPPRTGKEKPIFRGLVIALAGTLGGQWTDTNIIRWVTLREGEYSAEMTDAVTHLVCSHEEFKTRGSRVKKALKRGYKSCKIVTKDWLEDCMTKKRRLPEREYALDTEMKKERAKKKKQMRHQKGLEEGIRAVNSNLYHHYHDATFFKYEVTISREGDGARYVMSLYESNAKPHLYWFVAKFYKRKGDSQPKFHRPSATARRFHLEFAEFERFFFIKTGVSWEQRLMKLQGMGPVGKLYFRYEPPKGGKPVGYVPERFVAIEEEGNDDKAEEDVEEEQVNKNEEKHEDEEDVNAMVGIEENVEGDGLSEVAQGYNGGEMSGFVSGRFALAEARVEEEEEIHVPLVVTDLSEQGREKERNEEKIPLVMSDLSKREQKDTSNLTMGVNRRGPLRPVRLVPNYLTEGARLFPAVGEGKGYMEGK